MTIRKASTNLEGPPHDFDGDIKVSNKLPSHSDIQKVSTLPVLDAGGKPHTFKSLHDGKRKVLIVFIRHFFCGVSAHDPETSGTMLTACRIARNTFVHWPLSSLLSLFKLCRYQQTWSSSDVASLTLFRCTSKKHHVRSQFTRIQPKGCTNSSA